MVKTTIIQTVKAKVQEAAPGKRDIGIGTLMTVGTILVAKGIEIFNLTCDTVDPVKCLPGAAIIVVGGILYMVGAKYQANA